MKKIYFLLFTLTLFVPVSYAGVELYPQKINNFSPLDFSGLADVYKKIYEDANEEDEDEVLRRVTEYLGLLGEAFTQEEIETFCNINVPFIELSDKDLTIPDIRPQDDFPDKRKIQASTRGQDPFLETATKLQELCRYERLLLRLENNLSRRNTFRHLFSDDSLSNSPIDTITILQEIDNLFFGEKFEDQRPDPPTFLEYKQTNAFIYTPEFWQDQRPEAVNEEKEGALDKKDYGDFAFSIVGNIAGIDDILSNWLTQYSLVDGVTTKQFLEFPQSSGTSQKSSGSGSYQIKSNQDTTVPEVELVAQEIVGPEYEGIINDILNASLCNELTDSDRREGLETGDRTLVCQRERKQRVQNFIEDQRNIEKIVENKSFGVDGTSYLDYTFAQWNNNLEWLRSQAQKIREIYDDFITRPQAG